MSLVRRRRRIFVPSADAICPSRTVRQQREVGSERPYRVVYVFLILRSYPVLSSWLERACRLLIGLINQPLDGGVTLTEGIAKT